jgi:hypothetical protein
VQESEHEHNNDTDAWSQTQLFNKRQIALAKARKRQEKLIFEWKRSAQETYELLSRDNIEHMSDNLDTHIESIMLNAPLGKLLHPRTGLGQRRRSDRVLSKMTPHEQHEQLRKALMTVTY